MVEMSSAAATFSTSGRDVGVQHVEARRAEESSPRSGCALAANRQVSSSARCSCDQYTECRRPPSERRPVTMETMILGSWMCGGMRRGAEWWQE